MSRNTCAAYLAILLLMDCREWKNPIVDNGDCSIHMPTRGLVAHHPFTGNANDSSGNGLNGTVYGAILAPDRFGKQSAAYSFDGVNDYINIGNPAGDNPSEITQCAWIKSSAVPAYDLVILTKRHDGGNGSDWPTLSMEKSGSAACILDDANYMNSASSTTKINDNHWHFLCSIRDQTVYQIFVDGILEKEIIDGHAMGGSRANLHIGHHGAWNRYFNGIIDDVRIYNRALSLLEIDTLYHEGNYIPPLETPYISAYGTSETTIKILWKKVPEASSYALEHSTSPTSAFAKLYSGPDTTFTHTGLTKNQLVWYRLKASNSTASSTWSDTVSASAAVLPVTGLIVYFPFNGNANDQSGNNNNGIVTRTILTRDRHGNFNSAYSFNGSSYITVENNPSISIPSTQPFTISLWVYKLPSGLPLHILGKRLGCSSTINYQVAVDHNGFRFDSSSFELVWAAGIPDQKWIHVCITYDTNNGKLYLDEVLKSTKSGKIGGSNHVDLLIGASGSCGASWLGNLDDIRIYNRVLTSDEIGALYHENGWSN